MKENRQVMIRRLLYMLLIPVAQLGYFWLNRHSVNPSDINLPLDNAVPFVKAFVLPYVFWYFYVVGMLVFFAFKDPGTYFRLIGMIVTGMLVCFAVYAVYPTTVPRPEVTGADWLSQLVRMVYGNDQPVNCFPSIHMMDTLMITVCMFRYSKNFIFRAYALVSCISIYLATQLIKQHNIMDAVSATLLGYILYRIFTDERLASLRPVKKALDFLVPKAIRFRNFRKAETLNPIGE